MKKQAKSLLFLCDPDLVQIELHSGMVPWQEVNLVDFVKFMIVEYFDVFIFKQVKIHLVSVISNVHNE